MNETTPPGDSQTTLGLIERIREPSFVFSLASIALAVDIVLAECYDMNLIGLRWPLPHSILLGHMIAFIVGYALARSVLLPAVVWVMDRALYLIDDVWIYLAGRSLMFPGSRALPDHYVSVWALRHHAIEQKCEFAKGLADEKHAEIAKAKQAIGRLVEASAVCTILLVVDGFVTGSTVRQVIASVGWWPLASLVLVAMPWLGAMHLLGRVSSSVYYPELAKRRASQSGVPIYRRRNPHVNQKENC
jgi:hypothetical protein